MAQPRVRKHVLPTIRQKIKLYEKTNEILTPDTLGKRGICDCLKKAQAELNYIRDIKYPCVNWQTVDISCVSYDDKDNHMQGNFPELYTYKPEDAYTGGYWWENGENGFAIRKQVLSQIITKLKAELSEQIRSNNIAYWKKQKAEKEKKEYRKSHPDFDFDL